MRHICRDAAECLSLHLLHTRSAIAFRLIACHGGEDSAIRIGAGTICRALRKHASLMIDNTPPHNVLLHERRPRIERMRREFITVPNTDFCQIEYLNRDQCQQERNDERDMFTDFPISHPPPP